MNIVATDRFCSYPIQSYFPTIFSYATFRPDACEWSKTNWNVV